jgi:hypothetical protein
MGSLIVGKESMDFARTVLESNESQFLQAIRDNSGIAHFVDDPAGMTPEQFTEFLMNSVFLGIAAAKQILNNNFILHYSDIVQAAHIYGDFLQNSLEISPSLKECATMLETIIKESTGREVSLHIVNRDDIEDYLKTGDMPKQI